MLSTSDIRRMTAELQTVLSEIQKAKSDRDKALGRVEALEAELLQKYKVHAGPEVERLLEQHTATKNALLVKFEENYKQLKETYQW